MSGRDFEGHQGDGVIARDDEAERAMIGTLLLLTDDFDDVASQISPDDFYLGSGGFHGWLFTLLRDGQHEPAGVTAFILNHRAAAREFGVQNLAFELAHFLVGRDGVWRRFSVWEAAMYIRRLNDARKAREKIDGLRCQIAEAEQKWIDYERILPCLN